MMWGRYDRYFHRRQSGYGLVLTGLIFLSACAQKGDEFYDVQRYDAAADLYIQAAERGDVPKMMKLAEMYASGKIDYHRDYKQAVYWYTKAAGQGVVTAMFELGFIYEYGQGGVKQDYTQAVHWYSLAASHGNAYAQYRLAHVQAEQISDVHSDKSIEAYLSFLQAERMAGDCGDTAECRIVNGDLFNYRWLLERNLTDEQKQLARERLNQADMAQHPG